MTSKKFRLAIIGAGFGRYGLAPSFLKHPRFDLVAVCARRQETADQFASQYRAANAYSDWNQLLAEEIDVLAIAAPPSVQAEITAAALKKKIPLFLEKQVALTVSQSQEWVDFVDKNRIPTCVNFIFPSLNTWKEAKKYLTSGKIGKIRHVFVNWRMESYDNRLRTPAIWKTNDKQGGGILQHFLSHSLHYLEGFFGSIQELRCTLNQAPDLNAEGSTFASLDLIFKSGLIAHIAASSSAYSGIGHSLEMYGSEGSLLLKNETTDPVSGFKLFYAPRGHSATEVLAEASFHSEHVGDARILPTHSLISQFVDSLDGSLSDHPTLTDGHRVQVLLDCAIRAHINRNFVVTF